MLFLTVWLCVQIGYKQVLKFWKWNVSEASLTIKPKITRDSLLRPLLLATEVVDEITVITNVLLRCFWKYWPLKQYPLKPGNCLGKDIKPPLFIYLFIFNFTLLSLIQSLD